MQIPIIERYDIGGGNLQFPLCFHFAHSPEMQIVSHVRIGGSTGFGMYSTSCNLITIGDTLFKCIANCEAKDEEELKEHATIFLVRASEADLHVDPDSEDDHPNSPVHDPSQLADFTPIMHKRLLQYYYDGFLTNSQYLLRIMQDLFIMFRLPFASRIILGMSANNLLPNISNQEKIAIKGAPAILPDRDNEIARFKCFLYEDSMVYAYCRAKRESIYQLELILTKDSFQFAIDKTHMYRKRGVAYS